MTLDPKYYDQLSAIAGAIQEAPVLAQYLEEEEDDLYSELRRQFEPYLSELHHLVAAEAPLQLVTFEKYLLDPLFEGLYLPRVLGFFGAARRNQRQFQIRSPERSFQRHPDRHLPKPSF